MADPEIAATIGWASLLSAYSRVLESQKENPLFQDTLAPMFIEAAIRKMTSGRRRPLLRLASDGESSRLESGFGFYFNQRTPFYDQRILEAVEAGYRQVVLLGAGLDSRAFRLGLPQDVKVFELDQAPVLDLKRAVLACHRIRPDCTRIPVAVDLLSDWRADLASVGLDEQRSTLWIAEGLLVYLSREDADLLLKRITAASAPGSRIATEYFSRLWQFSDIAADSMGRRDWPIWMMLADAFRYGPVGDAPADWLSRQGWTHVATTTIAEAGRRYGRAVPPEFGRLGAPELMLFEGVYQPV